MALLTRDFLNTLADRNGGQIPQPMDMRETDQEALLKSALCDPDDSEEVHAALADWADDGGLKALFDHESQYAVNDIKDRLYVMLESSMVDDIDAFNSDADDREI